MNNNSKIAVSLILRLGAGGIIGMCLGVLFGFFVSMVGFDFGIWKLFWFVFWLCIWMGLGIGFIRWLFWLGRSDL
jgi:hypothetical protein